jgi:tetratricopeptide (TPR) repeat protein
VRILVLLPLLLGFFFSGCSFFSTPKEISVPEKEAKTLLRKGAELTSRNNYQVAEMFYRDAWTRYNLLDNSLGKAKANAGRIVCAIELGNMQQADSLFQKLAEYARVDSSVQFTLLGSRIALCYARQNIPTATLAAEISALRNPVHRIELQAMLITRVLFLRNGTSALTDTSLVRLGTHYLDSLQHLPAGSELENGETPALLAYALGLSSYHEKKYQSAEAFLTLALEKDHEIENTKGMADDSYLLGLNNFQERKYESAAAYFNAAEEMYPVAGDNTMASRSKLMGRISAYKLTGHIQVREEIQSIAGATKDTSLLDLIKKYMH